MKRPDRCLAGIILGLLVLAGNAVATHDYADALTKSIMFFEGQRSGKIPPTQRLTWRKDSALNDGREKGMDLTGGYYDAGDNVKFNFPMAFSTTVLAWGIIQEGRSMDQDLNYALEAVRWATDYFLKCTAIPGLVFAQVGDPYGDHNCWQRPEDMDTPRTVYVVSKTAPGSEVSAEMAAALAAASLVFRTHGDQNYSRLLLRRAIEVFEFADTYRGSYNVSIGNGACPFYCDFNGYEDELLWAAAWLHKATKNPFYWDYLTRNIVNFKDRFESNIGEFGWDGKNAGISVLVAKHVIKNGLGDTTPFLSYADKFVCDLMPQSPTRTEKYTAGGLLYKEGVCNIQNTAAYSFLVLAYAKSVRSTDHLVRCNNAVITPAQMIDFIKTQVNYILGDNPMRMSYMVGYGTNYPQKVHHRGSSLPSVVDHPQHIDCKGGTPYFLSDKPNPNQLTGAVVGGPGGDDQFKDDRVDAGKLEPTTYVNAPLVGLLAYLKAHSVFLQRLGLG